MKMIMEDKELQQYRYFIFDMDGTLTQSRTEIEGKFAKTLERLAKEKTIVIISGADRQQIIKQLPFLINTEKEFYILAQSGNDAQKNNEILWQNKLESDELAEIDRHIALITESYGYTRDVDKVEYRGGQVSFSLVGHNADKTKKKNFDPKGEIRRTILERLPFKSINLGVSIGGTTCFDYTRFNWNKKGNLLNLLREKNWKREDCIYFGDQLYKGGNDYQVKDLMQAINVMSPMHTYQIINSIYEKDCKEE